MPLVLWLLGPSLGLLIILLMFGIISY